MKARFDDRLGVSAVTYAPVQRHAGPGLALSLVLVFAIWIGWRRLCQTTGRTLAPVCSHALALQGTGISPALAVPCPRQSQLKINEIRCFVDHDVL